jgi:hypothetical protein
MEGLRQGHKHPAAATPNYRVPTVGTEVRRPERDGRRSHARLEPSVESLTPCSEGARAALAHGRRIRYQSSSTRHSPMLSRCLSFAGSRREVRKKAEVGAVLALEEEGAHREALEPPRLSSFAGAGGGPPLQHAPQLPGAPRSCSLRRRCRGAPAVTTTVAEPARRRTPLTCFSHRRRTGRRCRAGSGRHAPSSSRSRLWYPRYGRQGSLPPQGRPKRRGRPRHHRRPHHHRGRRWTR